MTLPRCSLNCERNIVTRPCNQFTCVMSSNSPSCSWQKNGYFFYVSIFCRFSRYFWLSMGYLLFVDQTERKWLKQAMLTTLTPRWHPVNVRQPSSNTVEQTQQQFLKTDSKHFFSFILCFFSFFKKEETVSRVDCVYGTAHCRSNIQLNEF